MIRKQSKKQHVGLSPHLLLLMRKNTPFVILGLFCLLFYVVERVLLRGFMSNEHIKKFLDEYLVKPSNDYAVLITGCWGSGKTYFISQYMGGQKVHRVRDFLMDSVNRTVVYISLFGAKSRENIENRIFEVLHPHLSESGESKFAQSGISLIKALASLTPLTKDFGKHACDALEYFNNGICEKARKSKKGLAVVFDDVERADMDPRELLGYVNEYVEHLGVSCILLADKERWDEANSKKYPNDTMQKLSSTQEKVIGKTFNIQTTIDNVLAIWLKDEENFNAKLLKILQQNESIIKEVVLRSGVNNFRSLKHSLLELEQFVKMTSIWRYLEKKEFAELFLREFIALRYSIYLGELKASDIGVSSYIAQIKDKTIEDSPYDKFQKRYQGFDFLSKCSVEYAKSWMDIYKKFFGENVVSVDIVKNVICDEIWFEGHDKYWMSKVGDFFMYDEDADGIEALKTFYASIKKGQILEAYNLYNIYYKLVFFADIGALKENKTEFQNLILDYARKNAKKFKSYKMDSANYYVSLFGESGKNGQDDNEEFWTKLKAIFDPFQKKIDSKKVNRAIDRFLNKFIPDLGDVYSLVMNNEWEKKDFEYFSSAYHDLDPKYGQKKHIHQAFFELKGSARNEPKVKDWCKKLLPLIELQWKEILKGPKPLKNSQLSVFYFCKALKELASC